MAIDSLNILSRSNLVKARLRMSINQSLIELQAIGTETTGSAIGSEFLIRYEAVSYSPVIPLSLTATYGLTLATLDTGADASMEASGIFLRYAPRSGPGDYDLMFGQVYSVPEPPTWR
jgi:hypothetical protein